MFEFAERYRVYYYFKNVFYRPQITSDRPLSVDSFFHEFLIKTGAWAIKKSDKTSRATYIRKEKKSVIVFYIVWNCNTNSRSWKNSSSYGIAAAAASAGTTVYRYTIYSFDLLFFFPSKNWCTKFNKFSQVLYEKLKKSLWIVDVSDNQRHCLILANNCNGHSCQRATQNEVEERTKFLFPFDD